MVNYIKKIHIWKCQQFSTVSTQCLIMQALQHFEGPFIRSYHPFSTYVLDWLSQHCAFLGYWILIVRHVTGWGNLAWSTSWKSKSLVMCHPPSCKYQEPTGISGFFVPDRGTRKSEEGKWKLVFFQSIQKHCIISTGVQHFTGGPHIIQ